MVLQRLSTPAANRDTHIIGVHGIKASSENNNIELVELSIGGFNSFFSKLRDWRFLQVDHFDVIVIKHLIVTAIAELYKDIQCAFLQEIMQR